jgi:hypothetical protein
MRSQTLGVCVVVLGILGGSAAAQDWTAWTASNIHEIEFRWLSSTANGAQQCRLQLRDPLRKADTVVSVRIDYKSGDAATSTRDTITITESMGETVGERTVDHCASVDELHVNDVVRR